MGSVWGLQITAPGVTHSSCKYIRSGPSREQHQTSGSEPSLPRCRYIGIGEREILRMFMDDDADQWFNCAEWAGVQLW